MIISTLVYIGQLPLDQAGTPIVTKYIDISQLVSIFLRNGLTLAGVILLGLIIFGGVSYIMAAGDGDQKKMAAAQETLTSALIGFLVIFLSYFIIQIIQIVTGLQIF